MPESLEDFVKRLDREEKRRKRWRAYFVRLAAHKAARKIIKMAEEGKLELANDNMDRTKQQS